MLLPGAGMFEAALGACNALADDSISTAPALVHVSIPAALQLPVPEVSCLDHCEKRCSCTWACQCIQVLRRPPRRAWQSLAP